MNMATPDYPGVSVVIRSFNRLESCLELIERVLDQDYPCFEVILIEQSTQADDAHIRKIEALEKQPGSVLRVLRRPPLGPTAARNLGWRNARNEIVLFVDDDDLPLGRDWIGAHARNFSDPDILGVSGRHVLTPDERCGYARPSMARRRCLSYSFLGRPRVYCRLDTRIDPVGWLHGVNASVRRSIVEELAGWDARLQDHEEHSFAFALKRRLLPGQRLVFDPEPVVLRRKFIPGGIGRRWTSAATTYDRFFTYYHRVVARFRRGRFFLFYPLYPFQILGSTIRWIWKDSHRYSGTASRLAASSSTLILSPFWYIRALKRIFLPSKTS